MTELPKTQITDHEKEVVSELVKHINAAIHRLRIFSGEANCNVYNRPDVEAAFKRAYERGVRVQIIAGPILSICSGSDYRSAVLEKVKRKELELYFRNRRSTERHFCLADDKRGVRQEYHDPMGGYEECPEAIPTDELLNYIERFDNWISTGIGVYDGHNFTVQFSHNPKSQFLLLDQEKIHQATQTAKDSGLRLDDMAREEIEELLDIESRKRKTGGKLMSSTSRVLGLCLGALTVIGGVILALSLSYLAFFDLANIGIWLPKLTVGGLIYGVLNIASLYIGWHTERQNT